MKLEYAKNPVWMNEEHTMIDLIIKWDNYDEELPFTASSFDNEEHGRVIFENAKNGSFGVVAEYVKSKEPTIANAEIPVTEF